MRPERDLGNEFIVTLLSVGVLALAVTFGVILTLSRAVPLNATLTAQAMTQTAMVSQAVTTQPASPEATQVVTRDGTAVSQMATITVTASMMETAGSTQTPIVVVLTQPFTATATAIERSPSVTQRPTLVLRVATATHTVNSSPPSATATQTAPPPSATPSPTPVIPSATATATQTTPPSRTPRPVATKTATKASSSTPAVTATPTLSITTLDATAFFASLTPQATACVLRADWVPYIVQRGDTLFSIRRQVGISLTELQQANCLNNISRIYVGQVVVIPPGRTVGPNISGTPQDMQGTNMIGCDNAAQVITSPTAGTSLDGVVTVFGTVDIPNFSFYKLEVRAEDNAEWNNFGTYNQAIQGGALGTLNTDLFSAGIYWIQLLAIDNTGNYPIMPCAVRVRFQ